MFSVQAKEQTYVRTLTAKKWVPSVIDVSLEQSKTTGQLDTLACALHL